MNICNICYIYIYTHMFSCVCIYYCQGNHEYYSNYQFYASKYIINGSFISLLYTIKKTHY